MSCLLLPDNTTLAASKVARILNDGSIGGTGGTLTFCTVENGAGMVFTYGTIGILTALGVAQNAIAQGDVKGVPFIPVNPVGYTVQWSTDSATWKNMPAPVNTAIYLQITKTSAGDFALGGAVVNNVTISTTFGSTTIGSVAATATTNQVTTTATFTTPKVPATAFVELTVSSATVVALIGQAFTCQ